MSHLSKALLNCYQIWNNRNNKVFKNIIPIPTQSLLIAANVGLLYFKVNCKQNFGVGTCTPHLIRWQPSHPSFIKLNFDGSVSLEKAVVAFVIRNEEGQPFSATAFNLDGATISLVEAISLKEGFYTPYVKVSRT